MGDTFQLWFKVFDESKIKKEHFDNLLTQWKNDWLLADLCIQVRKGPLSYKIKFNYINIKNGKIFSEMSLHNDFSKMIDNYKGDIENQVFLTIREFINYIEVNKENIFNEFMELNSLRDQDFDINMMKTFEDINEE